MLIAKQAIRQLDAQFQVDLVELRRSVVVEMETDKPYIEHEYHKKKYPPGQLKKKKSKKWVKAK